jgi:hypothetical protein
MCSQQSLQQIFQPREGIRAKRPRELVEVKNR